MVPRAAVAVAIALTGVFLSSPAAAYEGEAAAEAFEGGGQASVEAFGGPRERGLYGSAAHIELDLHPSVGAYGSYSEARSFGRTSRLGVGELTVGEVRLGGGVVDEDAAVHLGYAPRLDVGLHERVRLNIGLDLSLGASWLEEERARSDDALWRDLTPAEIDLWALGIGLDVTLYARPTAWLGLAVGAHGDVLAAAAPPGEAPKGSLLREHPLGATTEVGVSSALSDAWLGAFGKAEVRLAEWEPGPGRAAHLTASYLEAWDWIHLDPTYSALAYEEKLGAPLRFAPVPLRTTRRIEVAFLHGWGDRTAAGLAVDGQHVQGSTTLLGFADRNGWSIGARGWVQRGPLVAQLSGRYHFQEAEWEAYLGEASPWQVKGRLAAVLWRGESLAVQAEVGGQATIADDLGVPRDGQAAFVRVAVSFGGAPARRYPAPGYLAHPVSRARPPVRRAPAEEADAGDAATSGDFSGDSGSGGGFGDLATEVADAFGVEVDDQLAGEVQGLQEELRGIDLIDDPEDASMRLEEAFRRRPTLRERIDSRYPGLLEGLVNLSGGDMGGAPALAVGYGVERLRLAMIPRATGDASLEREAGDASEAAVLDRIDEVSPNLGATARFLSELQVVAPGELPLFLRENRLESVSIAAPSGDRYTLRAQTRTRWTRTLRRLLSGRPLGAAARRLTAPQWTGALDPRAAPPE